MEASVTGEAAAADKAEAPDVPAVVLCDVLAESSRSASKRRATCSNPSFVSRYWEARRRSERQHLTQLGTKLTHGHLLRRMEYQTTGVEGHCWCTN
eukprot:scaffold30434_cov29-Tisochrysis_lutea.AAC.5